MQVTRLFEKGDSWLKRLTVRIILGLMVDMFYTLPLYELLSYKFYIKIKNNNYNNNNFKQPRFQSIIIKTDFCYE